MLKLGHMDVAYRAKDRGRWILQVLRDAKTKEFRILGNWEVYILLTAAEATPAKATAATEDLNCIAIEGLIKNFELVGPAE